MTGKRKGDRHGRRGLEGVIAPLNQRKGVSYIMHTFILKMYLKYCILKCKYLEGRARDRDKSINARKISKYVDNIEMEELLEERRGKRNLVFIRLLSKCL